MGFVTIILIGFGCQAIHPSASELSPSTLQDLSLGFHSTTQPTAALHKSVEVVQTAFTEMPGGQVRLVRYVEPSSLPRTLGASAPPKSEMPGQLTPEITIDLGGALMLAGVDNPTINLAREQIQEALAGQLAARLLMVPNVNIGGNFRFHSGVFQDDPGFLRNPKLQSLYLGAGTGAIGAGTVAVPGVWLFTHLGDAIYEPAAAHQRVVAREFDSQGVKNAVLLEVATAYLELVGAQARLDLLHEAQANVSEIARITDEFAKAGEGVPADANRAKANAELVRRQVSEAEGAITAASAQLSRLLTIDSAARLRTPRGTLEPFRLVPENTDLASLVQTALESRPELFARSAAIQEAHVQKRQEQARPWLPLLSVGYSSGVFGGGSNQVADDFGPLKGRSDVDVMAVWNVQNLGFGNCARVRRAGAIVGQSLASYQIALNQVRQEVSEAHAAAKTAARQIQAAKVALTASEEGFLLESERIRLGQGRPIEVLDSFRQLLDAQQEWLRAVVAFDIAQFQLFVALGSSPTNSLSPGCEGHLPGPSQNPRSMFTDRAVEPRTEEK
jgi:outer membrane protein TolC